MMLFIVIDIISFIIFFVIFQNEQLKNINVLLAVTYIFELIFNIITHIINYYLYLSLYIKYILEKQYLFLIKI